jgi:hypothetical protein
MRVEPIPKVEQHGNLFKRTDAAFLLLLLAASRIAYYLAGVRFDTRPLGQFFQFIDPLLLQHRLIESLMYLHTQPPGLNLFAGIILKCFPDSYRTVFAIIYLILGAAVTLLLYSIQLGLGVGRRVALVITALFMISPGVVLFENFLLYEYIQLALLLFAAFSLLELLNTSRQQWVVLLCADLTALAVLRATYQWFYYAAFVAAIWWLVKERRKAIAIAGGIGLVVIMSIYVKNYVLFGRFVSSTWMGINADTITAHNLQPDERARLVKAGLISNISADDAPAPLSVYRAYIRPTPPTGIAVLDQAEDSTGRTNTNNIAFFQVEDYYVRDAKALLLHYPICYVRSVVQAWFTYFLPASDFPFFDRNRTHIAPWERMWNTLLLGQFLYASDRHELRTIATGSHRMSLVLYCATYLLVGLPLLWIWGCWYVYSGLKKGILGKTQLGVMSFLLINIFYVTMVSNFLSSFECNRYRFPIDAFYAALFGVFVQSTIAKLHGVPRKRVDIGGQMLQR